MIELGIFKDLRDSGTGGFITIGELMKDVNRVPNEPGVYFVLRASLSEPSFVVKGTGGFFKGKDPNVSISELKDNWIQDEIILYIGKAGGSGLKATLRSRLKQYMQFGEGKAVGHWGGRYIWQLKDSRELIVCWKVIKDSEPSDVETALIDYVKNNHEGRRPFANLSK